MRAGFYWPTLFSDIQKKVTSCHKFQIFKGKNKLLPLPLRPTSIETPFQQWGLEFIGEIHPASSAQHKWIMKATDYFTKWIETIPTRQASDAIMMKFMENNILAIFGCLRKIITHNAAAFRSKKMVDFCNKISDNCCVWSMIVQRSLFQLDVYPRKFCTPLHAGGTCSPRGGPRGPIPPGWGVRGPAVPRRGLGGSAPEAKNRCKFAL